MSARENRSLHPGWEGNETVEFVESTREEQRGPWGPEMRWPDSRVLLGPHTICGMPNAVSKPVGESSRLVRMHPFKLKEATIRIREILRKR